MQTYSEHQPTGFDPKGAFLRDRQSWLVLPVSRTRDSGSLDESNFAVALEQLGGESDTVEVHRFGHWGPGWYEIIIINPEDAAAVKTAEEIESALADYPILSDDDYSERQFNAAAETWSHMSLSERVETLRRHRVSIFAARREDFPSDDSGDLFYYLAGD